LPGPTGAPGATGAQGIQGEVGPPGPAGISVGYDPDWTGDGLVVEDGADTAAYIRNGNLVHFRVFVDAASVRDFGRGKYTLRLPFAPIQDYIFRDGGIHHLATDNRYQIYGNATRGDSILHLMYHSGSKDVCMDSNSPFRLDTKTNFYISGTFEISP
jgi:hypothetical protein